MHQFTILMFQAKLNSDNNMETGAVTLQFWDTSTLPHDFVVVETSTVRNSLFKIGLISRMTHRGRLGR